MVTIELIAAILAARQDIYYTKTIVLTRADGLGHHMGFTEGRALGLVEVACFANLVDYLASINAQGTISEIMTVDVVQFVADGTVAYKLVVT